ncbi:hypothetical protein [Alkalihalobacterium chitinilyticum]|uniref:Uncharacterized protein n=1 Tax=Alkalihalobacterium chitinilyticum TaxID=2980103 RepID=A0ABT5VDL4_9BACI|nr:hypothetical protein [Alkalihalobacterium chitinilyticum]MDE5412573.1 hypothetical protein [Alkalihalobacterium chitinilyticum]
MLNLKPYDNYEIDDLESDILDLYKKIAASNYLKDVQISELVNQTIDKLLMQSYEPLSFVDKALMIMNGLLSLGIKFTTYDSFERRFEQFLSILGNRVNGILEEQQCELSLEEKQAITEAFVLLYTRYMDVGSSSWAEMLAKWFIQNEQEQWVHSYYSYFKQLHEKHNASFHLSMITSLLALICQDGVGSLTYLRTHKQRLAANDLYFHFTLLNHRQEWDTMQRWFDLFSTSWNGAFGSLQPFYHTLERKKSKSSNFSSQLNKWMTRPALASYKDLSASLEESERNLLFNKVQESLNDQLAYPPIQNLWTQILQYERRWDVAIDYFLNKEHLPFQLSEEKQQLLAGLEKQVPSETIRIYHQFIVRLVEKKTRSHYSEAVFYMKKLKKLYELMDQRERFNQYITLFNQTYKTYRALIQEMKTIDE